MTRATRFRDVRAVNGGVWIACGPDGGEVTILRVAISTSRCLGAVLNCLRMETTFVARMRRNVET